jgi:malonate-semialdehyde dehydrogenase (acetylating)/methylmalonate-semialdehyde dehydrogenase
MSTTVPFLVGGRWESSASERRGDVFNPSTGAVLARVPFCTTDEIDRVVRCTADALPAWRIVLPL